MRYPLMKLLFPLPFLVLAACTGVGGEPVRTARAETRLTQALAGLVPGEPQRCLPRFRRNDQEIIDRGTILYRDGRDRVYRNDPPGGCGSTTWITSGPSSSSGALAAMRSSTRLLPGVA